MNDGPASALHFSRASLKPRPVSLLRIHELGTAGDNLFTCNLGTGTLALDILECRSGRIADPFSALHDRHCERMLGVCFERRGGGDKILDGGSISRHDVHDLRGTQRQRAGLVEDNGIELCRIFQCLGVLDENAMTGAEPGAHHDGHGRREPKGVRTGDDEDGDHQRDRKDGGCIC